MKKVTSGLDDFISIQKQKKYFRLFALVPIGIWVLIGLVGALIGTGIALTTRKVEDFLIPFSVGIVIGAIVFALIVIKISSQVLSVLYLERIGNDLNDIKKRIEEGKESAQSVHVSDSYEEDSFQSQQSFREENETSDAFKQDVFDRQNIELIQKIAAEEQEQRALSTLSAVLEIPDKGEFFKELKKWNEKFPDKLLYWDLELYNKTIAILNKVQLNFYTDETGKKHASSEISDSDFNAMKALILQYINNR